MSCSWPVAHLERRMHAGQLLYWSRFRTYRPGAGSITGKSAEPSCALGLIFLPPYPSSHSVQVGHQLPGCSVAASNHASESSGRVLSSVSRTQKLRLFLAGGLITPAMWPDAPSTNFCGPLSNGADAYAAVHGTM